MPAFKEGERTHASWSEMDLDTGDVSIRPTKRNVVRALKRVRKRHWASCYSPARGVNYCPCRFARGAGIKSGHMYYRRETSVDLCVVGLRI